MPMTTLPETTMPNLSEAQLQLIQQRLSDREADLQQRVRDAKAEAAERPSMQGPQVEDMAEEGEQRFRTGIEHVELLRDQEELTDISATRERIAHGRYGDCIDCGQEISFERLQAQPTALRCLACQGAFEKKHGTSLRYST